MSLSKYNLLTIDFKQSQSSTRGWPWGRMELRMESNLDSRNMVLAICFTAVSTWDLWAITFLSFSCASFFSIDPSCASLNCFKTTKYLYQKTLHQFFLNEIDIFSIDRSNEVNQPIWPIKRVINDVDQRYTTTINLIFSRSKLIRPRFLKTMLSSAQFVGRKSSRLKFELWKIRKFR